MIFAKEFYNTDRNFYSAANEFERFVKKEKIKREEIITIQYSSNGGKSDSSNSILLVYERDKK